MPNRRSFSRSLLQKKVKNISDRQKNEALLLASDVAALLKGCVQSPHLTLINSICYRDRLTAMGLGDEVYKK